MNILSPRLVPTILFFNILTDLPWDLPALLDWYLGTLLCRGILAGGVRDREAGLAGACLALPGGDCHAGRPGHHPTFLAWYSPGYS